ncbi:hypothetical protein DUNSADRAFT_15337 [Dunaliella salina]|uniref:Encoded protein n=1 Tax=Dunaliella salina TaxID=3046 RepID=A0ABQ7G5L4_DUNSA|nr:hypothetical protein DUNSADRAFT_15337 [Dunaliella salina]|eukprot:KAF5829894.1 hypothetical protein DUNSADRAFT_15337 [Dunaliella salina]
MHAKALVPIPANRQQPHGLTPCQCMCKRCSLHKEEVRSCRPNSASLFTQGQSQNNAWHSFLQSLEC